MPNVLAIVAHPDDIEFVMAGTLLQLAKRGWNVHYFNIANGCCGSMIAGREETAAIRLIEAKNAAAKLPATFYPPICDDVAIFYDQPTIAKVAAVVRMADPEILLTHARTDYMEDHETACRLAVTAAFVKGMPNYLSEPSKTPVDRPLAIYHAQPHGNCTPTGESVMPGIFVDIDDVLDKKAELLKCHASQDAWLDSTQKMSSYIQNMIDAGRFLGEKSGKFLTAEGFTQHLHLGFAEKGFDPLRKALSDIVTTLSKS